MANGLTLKNINGGSFNLQYSGTGLLPQTLTIAENGSGLRIQGDFSNATIANRTMFQTSTINGITDVGIVPNGTSTTARLTLNNNQDNSNASFLLLASFVAENSIRSNAVGTGTFLPLTFYTSNLERARLDTSGNFLVTGAGGLGYGTGSGGSVTQATSKSTAVTLNTPTGQITMNNAALAANTTVTFQFNNTSISGGTDSLLINMSDLGLSNASYNIWSTAGNGLAYIHVRNISAGSLSEAIKLNFHIIKGATA